MIGMWFSFGADSECLIESVAQFRDVYPDHKICIFDDKNKPISQETIEFINPDHYEKREFDSCGNLNGWNAIKGILQSQIKVQEMFPSYKGALKIDCDTLLMDDSWIDYDKPICGFDLGTQCLFAGMMRYLRKDAPQAILDELSGRWQWDTMRVPEDVAIGVYCLKIWGQECKSVLWRDGALSYSYINDEINKHPAKVITFGNRGEIKQGSPCDKRAFAGMAMGNYRKLTRNKQRSNEYPTN